MRRTTAGSSTQNGENFSTRSMVHHGLLMNTEVIKHVTILSRDVIREIMLQQEKTFKEQVHDLHKLYEVQRSLMQNVSGKRFEHFSEPASYQYPLTEGSKQPKRERCFWDFMNISSAHNMEKVNLTSSKERPISEGWVSQEKRYSIEQKPSKERKNCFEGTPGRTSLVRKREIDLEQLPADDTNDEQENMDNISTPVNVNLQKRDGACLMVHVDLKSERKLNVNSDSGVRMKPAPDEDSKEVLQVSQIIMNQAGEDYVTHQQRNLDPTKNIHRIQYFEASKLPVDALKPEQKLKPQAESSEKISQDTAKQTDWFIQGSESIVNPMRAVYSSKARDILVTQPVVSKASSNQGQCFEISKMVHPGLLSVHLGDKLVPKEDSSTAVGQWAKASVHKSFQGFNDGPKEGRLSCLPQREGKNGSAWFSPTIYSQGYQLASAIPAIGRDLTITERHGSSGFLLPAISPGTKKWHNNDSDTNIWYSQPSGTQLSQHQLQELAREQDKDKLVKVEIQTSSITGLRLENVKIWKEIKTGEEETPTPTSQVANTSRLLHLSPLKLHISDSYADEILLFRQMSNQSRNSASSDITEDIPAHNKSAQSTLCDCSGLTERETVKAKEKRESPHMLPSIADPTKTAIHFHGKNITVTNVRQQDNCNSSEPLVSICRSKGEAGVHKAAGAMAEQIENEVTVKAKFYQELALSGQHCSSAHYEDNAEGNVPGGCSRYGNHFDSLLVQGFVSSQGGSSKSEDIQSTFNENSGESSSEGKLQSPGTAENAIFVSKPFSPGQRDKDVLAPKTEGKALKTFELPLELVCTERNGNNVAINGQLWTKGPEKDYHNVGAEVKCDEPILAKSKGLREEQSVISRDVLTEKVKVSCKDTKSAYNYEKKFEEKTDQKVSPASTNSVLGVATARSKEDVLPSVIESFSLESVPKCGGSDSNSASNASQVSMQAISRRSNSSDMLDNFRTEVNEASVHSEKGSSSSSSKDTSPAIPSAGERGLSLASIKLERSNSQPIVMVEASDEVSDQDSDTDIIAATILLSLASKVFLQKSKNHLKEEKGHVKRSELRAADYSLKTKIQLDILPRTGTVDGGVSGPSTDLKTSEDENDPRCHSNIQREAKVGAQDTSNKMECYIHNIKG